MLPIHPHTCGISYYVEFFIFSNSVQVLSICTHWLNKFTSAGSPSSTTQYQKYRPKCEDIKKHSRCVRKEWKLSNCQRAYQEEIPCSKTEMKHDTVKTVTKYIGNCQLIQPAKPKPQEVLLSSTSFFGAVESSILPSVLEQIITGESFSDVYIQSLLIFRRFCENSYCIRKHFLISCSIFMYFFRNNFK
jgi:hypothetical protein